MKIHYALKKFIPALLIVAILTTGFFGVVGVETTNAQVKVYKPDLGRYWTDDNCFNLGIRPTLNVKVCLEIAAAWVGQGMLSIFGAVLGVGGLMLNETVKYTVLEMGKHIRDIGAITEGWKIFRDLANIILIFVLLAIGIATILRLEQYGMKALLAKLIIFALLINFSLFFTKVIIDASNILAIQAYNKTAEVGQKNFTGTYKWSGIADSYKQSLKLATVFDSEGVFDPKILASGLSFWNIALISILGSILFLVAAFAFFAGAFLLLVRFVALTFLMVLSPLAFVGMILPATARYAKQWWSYLLHYSIFAPIYFLLTLFVVKVINSPAYVNSIGLDGTEKIASIVNNKAEIGSIEIFINFFIVIFFIIASLIIAQQLGIAYSSTVIKWGQSARKWGQGVVGRNTIGRGSRLLGNLYDKGQAKMEKTTAGRVGRRVISGLSLGALSDKSIKGTFKAGEKAKFGGKVSLEDESKEFRARRKEVAGKIREMEQKRAAKHVVSPDEYTSLPRDQQAEQRELIGTIGKMNIKELEKPAVRKYLANENVAQHLSETQMESIIKSDEFTQQEIEKIKDARFARVLAELASGSNSSLRTLGDKEVEMVGDEVLRRRNVIKGLSQSQVGALKKSNKINSNLKKYILDERKNIFDEMSDSELEMELRQMKPVDIAKVDSSILTKPAASKVYSPAVLIELAKELKIKERDAIRTKLNLVYTAAGGKVGRNMTKEQKEGWEWLNLQNTPSGVIF